MTKKIPTGFGSTKEWKPFIERHEKFFQKFSDLQAAIEEALLREIADYTPTDLIVFISGHLCIGDFQEILLLCGNGYGVGAMKILRGMYERAVIARYLHLHSEEAKDFIDFYWINEYKLENGIKKAFGEKILNEEQREQHKRTELERNKVKDKFMIPDCKKCGTIKLNHTWSKKDFVTMAGEVGKLGELILFAYNLSTQQLHGTVHAMNTRLKRTVDGGITFDHSPRREEASICLMVAHGILMNILALQCEHFKLQSLEKRVRKCGRDFESIWKKTPSLSLNK